MSNQRKTDSTQKETKERTKSLRNIGTKILNKKSANQTQQCMRRILYHEQVSFILGILGKAGAVTENQCISTVSIGLRRGKSYAIS